MARDGVAAGKAVGGGERDARERPAGLGALRVGDAGDRPRRVLADRGAFDQGLGRRLDVVADVQLRRGLGQLGRVGQAAVRILRHRARHGQRAVHQLVEGGRRVVRGGHDRLAPPDQDPEAEVLAFLTLQAFELAQALGMGERDGMREQGVGGVGTGGPGFRDQAVEQVERVVCGGHGCSSQAESGGSRGWCAVIPKVTDNGSFHGSGSGRPGRRRNATQVLNWAAPMRPTRRAGDFGRQPRCAPLVVRVQRRSARLAGGQNRLGEMSHYQ